MRLHRKVVKPHAADTTPSIQRTAMPVVHICPECQKQMRVPDALLGKTMRCPNCKAVIAAPKPKEPEPMAEVVQDEMAEVVEDDAAFTEEPPRPKVPPASRGRGRTSTKRKMRTSTSPIDRCLAASSWPSAP